ncbi:MAG: ribonucleotide-diphosphate reductase subunit beta, partial [Actinomycetota bacterium]
MTADEAFSHVTDAPLAGLGAVPVEDVYGYMDHLLDRRASPYDLYLRWESQQWSTQDLDFSEDRVHWRMLDDGFRDELMRPFSLFFMGEQLVADTLAPFVTAAPTEQERLFLATQLVDEARHAVFFARFFHEVLGAPEGLGEAQTFARTEDVPGFDRIFRTDLTAIADHLRADPGDYGMFVEGITLYHMIVEGMLALTGQMFLLRLFRENGMMPAFTAGFTAVARDESRHVSYGVWALRRACARPELVERIADAVIRWAVPAAEILEAPDREWILPPDVTPEQLQIDPREVRNFSTRSLAKRLRAAGIPEATWQRIEAGLRAAFEDCTRRYEERFG